MTLFQWQLESNKCKTISPVRARHSRLINSLYNTKAKAGCEKKAVSLSWFCKNTFITASDFFSLNESKVHSLNVKASVNLCLSQP